jgi:hypothetical protein
MPLSQNSSILRLLASALVILLVGCASASLPEAANALDEAQAAMELSAAGPPTVEIFAEGEGSVPELQVGSGERINLVAAASGQDLTYQWHLAGD